MDHNLTPSVLVAANGSVAPDTDDTETPTAWRARMRRLLIIDFDGLDSLDLGTPKEFDIYICGLFERERPPKA